MVGAPTKFSKSITSSLVVVALHRHTNAMMEFTANINGAKINYARAGSGPPLLLLHAGIADHRMWQPQFSAFADRFDVIAPDHRGFGKTMPIDGPFAFYKDVETLLDHLSIVEATVVGCSFGGAIALDFALSCPERVSGLALICAAIAGFEWKGPVPEIAKRINAACEADEVDIANNLEIDRWIVGDGRERADVPADVIDLTLDMNRIALCMPELGEEIEPEPEAFDRLEEIRVPTLIIGAEHDDPISKARTKVLSVRIPKAQTIWIKHAGHLPSLEQPDVFNSALSGFLSNKDLS